MAKAQKEKRYNKVKTLQHLLITSFEAIVFAVKRVTSNKQKRTPGVDKKMRYPSNRLNTIHF
ncbi:reverse transcriptase N-terminal domain-containing protein [Bacteroides ovatus]|uniref:reverse transcriptase N-terminal domain-containing protein n=1 Tax=Bacteroides ovatus TaxID=28116 RepID=UPI003315C40B